MIEDLLFVNQNAERPIFTDAELDEAIRDKERADYRMMMAVSTQMYHQRTNDLYDRIRAAQRQQQT